jgi:hypothetical protein
MLIPDCIDEAMFQLLRAIDAGVLRLSFVANNDKTIDLKEDGLSELAGWFAMGHGGWKSRFSRQRFVDDL